MGILATVSNAGGGTDIAPIIKYNATNGIMSIVDRVQGPQGWESVESTITFPTKFVIDMENMLVGPMAFVAQRPDFHLVRIADIAAGTATIPDRPSIEHRHGFIVRVYAKSIGLREWRGMARCVINALDQIYEQFSAAPEAAQGLLPVIEITGVNAVKRGGQYPGTDMIPILAITQWVPRPEALQAKQETPKPQEMIAVTPVGAAMNGSSGASAPVAATPQGRRPPAHVPPPRVTTAQVAASQVMQAPLPPPGGDDEVEFA